MIALLATATLTLGPASLSLPELAQALTKAGMPTEAGPGLADRGAFVRLKNRTPEATRRLLSEALGVAFTPQGAGWRMVVDPAVKAREAAFLAQYRRQAAEKAQAWVTANETLRAGRGYATLDRDVQGASKAFEEISNSPDAATKAKLRRLFSFNVLLNPAAWIGLRTLNDPAAVSAAIVAPVLRNVPITEVEKTFALPLSALGPQEGKTLTTALFFDPATGKLTGDAWGSGGQARGLPVYPFRANVGGFAVAGTGGLAEARVEGVTLVETFNRMGQAAGDYLRSFEPRPALPEKPVAMGPMPATLSNVLERLDVEAVMELSPRFEGLPVRQMPATLSLRDALAILPYPAPTTGKTPAWLLEVSRREDWSGVVARARAFPWRIRVRDGAFLIVDPLTFLDRAQWLSPVPSLKVERILAALPPDAPTDLSGTRLPDWAHLEEIARAVAEGPGLVADYRGLGIGTFAPLIPIARLVALVPAEKRSALWQEATRTGGTKVEVDGGTLTLEATRWGSEYGYAKPVLRVVGAWTGPKGPIYGEGTIDPRGL